MQLDTSTIATIAGWVIYLALAAIALWGAYCVIAVWRRVAETRFRTEESQNEFLRRVDESLTTGDFDGAAALCEGDRRAMPQLVGLAIANRAVGYSKLRNLVAERFQRDVLADLEHRLSWVQTVIKSAPMVGLLGTVIGMMGAFAKVGGGDQVDPTAMAQDISFALTTTACGLAIAIPLVLCTASINVRIRKLADLVGPGLTTFLDSFRAVLTRPSRGA